MTLYPESYEVYNKIKAKSKLNDDALTLIGITQGKVNDAIHQCKTAGMTRTQAAKTVYNLWAKANPDVQSNPPTKAEMELLGFTHTGDTWTHTITMLQLSDDYVKNTSFRDIENAVFKEAKDLTKDSSEGRVG